MKIEKMTKADAGGVFEVEKACFATPWPRAAFEYETENPDAAYFAATENGQVLGYIGMRRALDEGQIMNLAVAPSARRAGLGRALAQKALAFARESGLNFLTLEVNEHNAAARRLYESLGFRAVGRRKRYYENRDDAVLMTLYLMNRGENA